MLFLDDLLALPITGFKSILRTLAKVAEEQYTDDAPIKERLLHLQVELEEGTITEDEYVKQEAEILRELRAVHTVVDGPQGFANSVPLLAEATNPDCALVRLHGRNVDTYNAKGASSAAERFDYDYPDQELREIMVEVIRLAYKVRNTHLIFNNCDEDKGQRNGITFMKMLLAHG